MPRTHSLRRTAIRRNNSSRTGGRRAPRLADAVIIATQDPHAHRAGPRFRGARLSHLEKPSANAGWIPPHRARVAGAGIIFMILPCYALYQYTRALKACWIQDVSARCQPAAYRAGGLRRRRILSSAATGAITAESSCMLLAKCCHDLDWFAISLARLAPECSSSAT